MTDQGPFMYPPRRVYYESSFKIASSFAFIFLNSSPPERSELLAWYVPDCGLPSRLSVNAGLPKLSRLGLFWPVSPSLPKHCVQRTGFFPFGLKGTSHELSHWAQVALCIVTPDTPDEPSDLRSRKFPPLGFLLPRSPLGFVSRYEFLICIYGLYDKQQAYPSIRIKARGYPINPRLSDTHTLRVCIFN